MWFFTAFDRLDEFSNGNGAVCVAAAVGAILLFAVATVSCLCKNAEPFFCVAFLTVGGLEGVFYAMETPVKTAVLFRSAAWVAVGTVCLLTSIIIALLRRAAKRKKRLIVSAKKTELLPEQDNTYVRARLQTALRVDTDGGLVCERKSVPYENRGAVRLGYARRLIAGVQDAPLSPAERLEIDALDRSFAEYSAHEKWTAEQLRAVNELFARLMKLAAKYSVGE